MRRLITAGLAVVLLAAVPAPQACSSETPRPEPSA
jgi:hypothetical protein